MTKFTKFSLLAAAGLFTAGCLLGSISAFAGGGITAINNDIWAERTLERIGRAVYHATDGRLGYLASDRAESSAEAVKEKETRASGESNSQSGGLSGRTDEGDQIALSNVSKIEMELGAGTFYLVEKEEDDGLIDVYIEEVVGRCRYEVKKGELYISGFQNVQNMFDSAKGINRNRVEVRVPKGSYFDEIDLEIGACTMEVSGVEAGKMDVSLGAAELILTDLDLYEMDADVGAGRIEAQDVRIVDGDITVGVGECVYDGTISGNLDLECGMGNIDLSLTGSESDHNYEIECSMGNVDVGSYSFASFGDESHINNHAGSKFEIECDMGNITISFED